MIKSMIRRILFNSDASFRLSQANRAQPTLFPAKYADDVARTEQLQREKELGVEVPTADERISSATTTPY